MRRILLPLLLLGLVAGCSAPKIGPHRIDVQQGNALDQENISRLKTGLNRAQVRFLLGTPLIVDPFRTDRWDYVYLFYAAGRLTEQKRVSLFFEDDILVRIEGDMPGEKPAEPVVVFPPSAVSPAARIEPAAVTQVAAPSPVTKPVPDSQPGIVAEPAIVPRPTGQTAPATRTVVPPMPSPRNAPAYVDPRTPVEPPAGMIVETDVARIQPDIIPPFPEPAAAPQDEEALLQTVNVWAQAWAARDLSVYLSAYDPAFVPQGGGSRADWEKRRRLLLGKARNIDIRIDSASVEHHDSGEATVTFNQFYRSDTFRDAVVKQLRLTPRDGRWMIVEEKVLSVLKGAHS